MAERTAVTGSVVGTEIAIATRMWSVTSAINLGISLGTAQREVKDGLR